MYQLRVEQVSARNSFLFAHAVLLIEWIYRIKKRNEIVFSICF